MQRDIEFSLDQEKTFCIIYKSEASLFLNEHSLQDMVISAAEKNRKLGVTGILLSDGHAFFQQIEGSKQSIQSVFKRIRNSPLHGNIGVIFDSEIEQRLFPEWSMILRSPKNPNFISEISGKWSQYLTGAKLKKHPIDQILFMREYIERLTL